MAYPDSLVRLRQTNKPEVSGFVVDIISGYLADHGIGQPIDTGAFLLLVLNLSGYVTSGDITGFATKAELSGARVNILAYVGANYYSLSNPSGFIGSGFADTRYVRGQGVQNDTNVILHDPATNKYPFYFTSGNDLKLEGSSSLMRLNHISLPPLLSGFNISGIDIKASKLQGQPVMSSGYIATTFVPNTKFTAGQAGNGFQYALFRDTLRNKQFVFEQDTQFYMEGQHAVNIGDDYIIDLYGTRAAAYGLEVGAPYILGFDVYAGKLTSSGYSVLTTRDISLSGFATYSQLTGTSGALHDEIGTVSTRLVNTGSYIFRLLTGVSGSIPNNEPLTVKITGNQTVSGAKTFTQTLTAPGIIDAAGNWIQVNNGKIIASGFFNKLDWINGYLYMPDGTSISLDWENKLLSGTWNVQNLNANSLTINGSGVPDFSKVVFTTGTQVIGGNKEFSNTVTFDTLIQPFSVQTPTVLSEGTIFDLAGQPSLKWERRKLYDASGNVTENWHDKILTGGTWQIQGINTNSITLSGQPLLATTTNVVYTTGDQRISGHKDFGFQIGVAFLSLASTGFAVIDIGSQSLIDGATNTTLNWSDCAVYSPLGGYTNTLDWSQTFLKTYTDESITLDWTNRRLSGTWNAQGLTISGVPVSTGATNINTGSFVTTGQTGAFYPASNPSGFITSAQAAGVSSLNITGRNLSGALTFTGLHGVQLSTGNSSLIIFDGINFVQITGNQTVSGVKTFNDGIKVRFITDLTSSNFIDLNNPYLNDSNQVPAVDWNARYLIDTSTVTSVDWSQRQLYNSSSTLVLDWDSTVLRGSWDSEGLTIFAQPVITGSYSAYTGISGTSGSISAYSVTSGATSYNLVFRSLSGWTGINLSKASGDGYLIFKTTGVVITSQTGSFITTANTGSFVSVANTGSFITTGQTGSFITTANTGSFITTANTGSFITTANTGSFITTAQTGQFYASSNPSGFITSAQAAGVNSITITGLSLSGGLTFVSVSGISIYTGNSTKIYFDGAGLVGVSGTQTITGAKTFTSQMAVSGVDGGFSIGANGLAINQVPVSGLGAGVVMATTETTLAQAWQFFAKGSSKHFFVGRANIRDCMVMDGNSSMIYFPGGNGGAALPTTTGTLFVACGTANQTALIVRGKSALTTDLTQWRDTNDNNLIRISPSGLLALGAHAPTAVLHLKAGGSGTGTAPLKFISGSLLTTGELGAMEFDGLNWYVTDYNTGRYMLIHSGVTGRFVDGASIGGVRTINVAGTIFSGTPTFTGAGTVSLSYAGNTLTISGASSSGVGGGAGVNQILATGGAISGNITMTGQRAINVRTSGQTILISGSIMPAVNLLSGTTVTIDWRSGDIFYHLLTGDTTFSFTGESDGQQIDVAVTSTGVPQYAVTWSTGGNFKWLNGSAPIQTSDSSSGKAFVNLYTFYKIGIMTLGKATQSFSA